MRCPLLPLEQLPILWHCAWRLACAAAWARQYIWGGIWWHDDIFTDQIGDGSEGCLLGGMGNGMVALTVLLYDVFVLSGWGVARIPEMNLDWMRIGFDGVMGMSGWV